MCIRLHRGTFCPYTPVDPKFVLVQDISDFDFYKYDMYTIDGVKSDDLIKLVESHARNSINTILSSLSPSYTSNSNGFSCNNIIHCSSKQIKVPETPKIKWSVDQASY